MYRSKVLQQINQPIPICDYKLPSNCTHSPNVCKICDASDINIYYFCKTCLSKIERIRKASMNKEKQELLDLFCEPFQWGDCDDDYYYVGSMNYYIEICLEELKKDDVLKDKSLLDIVYCLESSYINKKNHYCYHIRVLDTIIYIELDSDIVEYENRYDSYGPLQIEGKEDLMFIPIMVYDKLTCNFDQHKLKEIMKLSETK